MSKVRDATVIGAGISGLTCAYRLRTLGLDAVVIERSPSAGGVIKSDRIDGFLIERGPNSTQGTEDFLGLVDELGLSARLVEGDPRSPAYVYFGGRLHAVPSGLGSFLRSGLLSPIGKLRLMSEPLVGARRLGEEETVADFARRRLGAQTAERLVAPFVSGIYAGDSTKLSVQAAFPRLASLESDHGGLFRGMLAKARQARREMRPGGAARGPVGRRLCSFRNGMSELPRALASRLGNDLRLGCERITLSPAETDREGSLFSIRFDQAGQHTEMLTRELIVATRAPAAAELLAPLSQELSALLKGVEYPPLAIIHMGYPKPCFKAPLRGFGFLVAPRERMNLLGCVWNSSLFTGRSPEGHELLTAFIGGARNPSATLLSDDELAATTHAELKTVLGLKCDPRVVGVTRYQESIPQYNLGHAGRVNRIEKGIAEIKGLGLIGNYLHGVSVADCVSEADRRARDVAGRSIPACSATGQR